MVLSADDFLTLLCEVFPDDRRATFADIAATTRDLGFVPRTPIDDGIPQFVAWFRAHHGV